VKKVEGFEKNIGDEGNAVFGYMVGEEWIGLGTQDTDDETWEQAAKDLKASVPLLKAIAQSLEMHRDNVGYDLEDMYKEFED
jgi:hypothetical protein